MRSVYTICPRQRSRQLPAPVRGKPCKTEAETAFIEKYTNICILSIRNEYMRKALYYFAYSLYLLITKGIQAAVCAIVTGAHRIG
jgi:hypothetical protein